MNNLKKSFTSSERAHTENIQVQVDPDDTISMDNMCGYIYDKSMSPCKSSEVKSKLSISQDQIGSNLRITSDIKSSSAVQDKKTIEKLSQQKSKGSQMVLGLASISKELSEPEAKICILGFESNDCPMTEGLNEDMAPSVNANGSKTSQNIYEEIRNQQSSISRMESEQLSNLTVQQDQMTVLSQVASNSQTHSKVQQNLNKHSVHQDLIFNDKENNMNQSNNKKTLMLNPEINEVACLKETSIVGISCKSEIIKTLSRDESEEATQKNKAMGESQNMNSQQQDIQKLIEEVTKKDENEKWLKCWDDHLVSLVSHFKVENIGIVTEKMNKYIDSRRALLPAQQQSEYYELKSVQECMDRWLGLRNNTEDGTVKQIKGNWTPEEDMILKKKVHEYGLKKWKEIATFLPGRIGKQCRERWYNNVDPNLNKDKWTIAEDLQLMELHKLYGNRWVQIQKHMPGRIDNDIKNRFNASLRKYKTFEQYVEANDRKRDKCKKKYYWRQHYELRNVNNSKRLPLNDQDKEFKDMAQQKIQMEVGSNLPPLKNDLIIEKKRELEEYQELKKLKAKFREEKKLQKQRERSAKKRSINDDKDENPQYISGFDYSNYSVNGKHQQIEMMKSTSPKNYFEIKQGKNKNVDAQSEFNVKDKIEENDADMEELTNYKPQHQANDATMEHAIDNQKDTLQQVRNNPQEFRLDRYKQQARDISADANYKDMFKAEKVPEEELNEQKRMQPRVDAFQLFQSNRQFRELYMPPKKIEPSVVDDLAFIDIEKIDKSRKSSISDKNLNETVKLIINSQSAKQVDQTILEKASDDKMKQLQFEKAEQQVVEITRNVENITKRCEIKSSLENQDQISSLKLASNNKEISTGYDLKFEMPSVKVLLKRYELLKKIQDQVNQIKRIRQNQQKLQDMKKQEQRDQLNEKEIRQEEASNKRQKTDESYTLKPVTQYRVAKSYIKLPEIKRPVPDHSQVQRQISVSTNKSMLSKQNLLRSTQQLQVPFYQKENVPQQYFINKPTKIDGNHQQILQNLLKFRQLGDKNQLIKISQPTQNKQIPMLYKPTQFDSISIGKIRPQMISSLPGKNISNAINNQSLEAKSNRILADPKIQQLLQGVQKQKQQQSLFVPRASQKSNEKYKSK